MIKYNCGFISYAYCATQRGVFDMAQVSNNESNRFTKDCIYEALWELLKQHPYDSITITQIAKKAGVSRNAIYRNFESKDAIIKKRLYETYEDFIKKTTDTPISSHEEYINIVFEHLCNEKEIALTLANANLFEFILESFLYIKGNYNTNTENTFYENYRIGGTLCVYLTWILTGCKETPKQLADIVNHICTSPAVTPDLNNK